MTAMQQTLVMLTILSVGNILQFYLPSRRGCLEDTPGPQRLDGVIPNHQFAISLILNVSVVHHYRRQSSSPRSLWLRLQRAPCMWYARVLDSLGVEEEQASIKNGRMKEKIEKETLLVITLNDAVSSPERVRIAMQTGVEGGVEGGKLAMVEVDSGHRVMLERAEETNRILEQFFEKGVKGFGKQGLKAFL